MIFLLIFFQTVIWAKEISVFTFNLHGLHPMGEQRRIVISEDGSKSLSWSHLHYFTKEELERGHEKRQTILSQDLSRLSPDIAFFQEVGGGYIDKPKTCTDFYNNNNVKDLNHRLKNFSAWTACRGNVGWWSDSDTFKNFEVLTEDSQETIFQKGSNPYPHGVIVEGLGILTSPKIIVHDHVIRTVPINRKNETFFFHAIRFGLKDEGSDWWIAVNVHGGHKVQNFEQAVAMRLFLTRYLAGFENQESFKGFIVAGDFNAWESQSEVSSTPWSFHHRWQTPELLKKELTELNYSNQKPFASLPPSEANERIHDSVHKLFSWFSVKRNKLDGSLHEVCNLGPCSFPMQSFGPHCKWKDKIDHIYLSENLKVLNYSGTYKQNNWTDLAHTLSDHPGLWARIDL